MSTHHSLTDEKQALLARMQASRTAYQRMLTGEDEGQAPAITPLPENAFPRSKTMRWVKEHPYLTLIGLSGVVLASRRSSRQAARSIVRKSSGAAGAFSRNHQAIRSAIGIVAMLTRAIEQRRIEQRRMR